VKKIFFLIPIVLFTCSNNIKNCSNFKTGTFKYLDNNPEEVIVIRNDTSHIEINKRYNTKIISDVEWVSDCEFIITPKEFINYPDERISKPISVQIIESKGKTFVCMAEDDSLSFKIKMMKVD